MKYAHLEASKDFKELSGRGDWIIGHLKLIESEIRSFASQSPIDLTIDMSNVDKMDSAGALLLENFIRQLHKMQKKVTLVGLKERYTELLKIIEEEIDQTYRIPSEHYFPNILKLFGKVLVDKSRVIVQLLSFVGEVIGSIGQCVVRPKLISWRSVSAVFHNNCYLAMPIVGLLNFLIGVVITFQIGIELKSFGMNLFIINLSSMIMFRELAPLMTAIIVAGRTTTSFTAQLGSMIANEEIDALRTMGVSPVTVLVIPKLIGILIAFPLLLIWADIFAMLGSMVIAKITLGISFVTFLDHLQQIHPMRSFLIGLLKTPFFALLVTIIGCFQGFSAKRTSYSIGIRTTHSAVQALFLIVIVNSLFSIIFSWQGV